MIDEIPYDLYRIAATYLSAYDLKSLTEISPFLRNAFEPSSWNLIYVLPAERNGSQKKLVEYIDYRFVDETFLVNVTKYGWFKREHVRQIIFDHRCALLKSDTIERIDLDQFPSLQHVKAEVLPLYWVDDVDHKLRLCGNQRYTTLDNDVLYPDGNSRAPPRQVKLRNVVNMQYPFTNKITSGSFHAKYTMHLMVSSIYHWHNVCNHTLITKLNLIWMLLPDNMDILIFGLRRCVNVEWLAIKLEKKYDRDLESNFRQKYLGLMSVCKSLKKLRYLQTSNVYKKDDPMLVLDCILRDLDESVYYEYQIDIFSGLYEPLINNMEIMTFPCVKALEIIWDCYLVYLTGSNSQFKAFFPNLQHLSLSFIRLGDYLNDMVGSFAEGLQTLKVTVHGPPDMMWFVRTLPRLKRLRVLHVKDWKYINRFGSVMGMMLDKSTYFDHIYHQHGAKYDNLLKHIVNGGAGASLEDIRTWSRSRVEDMVASVIAKCANVKDGEIDYMVNLILDPEAIVTEFGSLDCFDPNYLSFDENSNPKFQYMMSYYYAAWESIFMKCQQLKHLEKLTIAGTWQPFVSPNLEKLICNHDTLKRVKICLSCGNEPVNLQQVKYSRLITRRVTPVTGYFLQCREKKTKGFCHTYWVDVEGFRKQFAHEIYKEGDYEDVEYTALATSEQHLIMIENDYISASWNNKQHIEEGSYRFGQEANTWDFGIQLYCFI